MNFPCWGTHGPPHPLTKAALLYCLGSVAKAIDWVGQLEKLLVIWQPETVERLAITQRGKNDGRLLYMDNQISCHCDSLNYGFRLKRQSGAPQHNIN